MSQLVLFKINLNSKIKNYNIFISQDIYQSDPLINLSYSVDSLRDGCQPRVLKLLHSQGEDRTLNHWLKQKKPLPSHLTPIILFFQYYIYIYILYSLKCKKKSDILYTFVNKKCKNIISKNFKIYHYKFQKVKIIYTNQKMLENYFFLISSN